MFNYFVNDAGVAQRQRSGFVNRGLKVRFLSPALKNRAGTQAAKGDRLYKCSVLPKGRMEK
jgi:hypothetical protein